jgi:hypothetical protein
MARGVIHSKVRGVTHDNPDKKNRQAIIKKHVKVGLPLTARREPNNPVDKNAIGLWVEIKGLLSRGESQIGYISSELAEELSHFMMKGGRLEIKVTDVTGGGRDESLGVNIEIKKVELKPVGALL